MIVNRGKHKMKTYFSPDISRSYTDTEFSVISNAVLLYSLSG